LTEIYYNSVPLPCIWSK